MNNNIASSHPRKIMSNLQINSLNPDISLTNLCKQSPNNNKQKFPQYRLIKSAKNQYKKSFIFPTKQPKIQLNLTYEKLKHEKSIIVREIQNLKQGAVNAINQKEEQIESLKEIIQNSNMNNKIHQQQQLKALHLDLQMKTFQLDSLKKQFIQLKNKFVFELPQKDRIVLQLGQQIDKCKLYINQLNESSQLIKKRLSEMELQNQSISEEIMNQNQSIIELKEFFNNSAILGSSNKSEMQSIRSHLNKLNDKSDENNQEYLHFLNQKQRIEQLKLQLIKMKQKHNSELLETKQFYQDKIEKLRIQYEILQVKKDKQIESEQEKFQYNQIQNEKEKTIKYNLKSEVIILQNLKVKTEDDGQKKSNYSINSKKLMALYGDNESQFSSKHFHYEPKLFNIKEKDEMYEKQKSHQQIKIIIKNELEKVNNTQNEQKKDIKQTIKLIFIGVIIGSFSYLAYKYKRYNF